jgi:hypothetical protein
MTTKGPVVPAPAAEVPIVQAEKSVVDIKTGEIAHEEPLAFDPAALKEKYIVERDKRLARNQGVEQYLSLDGKLSHFLRDPWVESGFEREPVEEEVDVVIVGGGYGAQVVAVRLIEAGVNNFRIIEKAGDFGGTWYWNRYPGMTLLPYCELPSNSFVQVQCVTSSHTYTCLCWRKLVICRRRSMRRQKNC